LGGGVQRTCGTRQHLAARSAAVNRHRARNAALEDRTDHESERAAAATLKLRAALVILDRSRALLRTVSHEVEHRVAVNGAARAACAGVRPAVDLDHFFNLAGRCGK